MKLTNFDYSEYEPSEMTDNTILTEDSLALISESIRMQFEDPSGHGKVDAVSAFITRYKVTVSEAEDDCDEEELARAKDIHRRFIAYMESLFKDKLKIGIPELDDMGEEEQDTMIHYLYRFFITNVTQNMLNFVKAYIKKNKTSLGAVLPGTKTVSSRRFSDIMDDDDMIRICSNLSDVVKLALTDKEITVTDFLEMCRSKEDDLEREFINEQYDNFGVTGNFVNRYRKMLPEWCIIELESALLTYLVSKYRRTEN